MIVEAALHPTERRKLHVATLDIFVELSGVEAGNLALRLPVTGALIGDPRVGFEAMRQKEHEAGGAASGAPA